jgi:radical SAM protein with 4Fe4S-binding SPASM domain
MSMTVKSNGEIAMCMDDFNNDIILGDAKNISLHDIWNGDKYRQFRADHIELKRSMKCMDSCDMRTVGSFFT